MLYLLPNSYFKSHASHVAKITASAICKMQTLKHFLPGSKTNSIRNGTETGGQITV